MYVSNVFLIKVVGKKLMKIVEEIEDIAKRYLKFNNKPSMLFRNRHYGLWYKYEFKNQNFIIFK